MLFEVPGGGRTLGKRAAGLRVVTDGGAPVGLRASLIRNFIRLFEGFMSALLPCDGLDARQKNNQRLGDHAAGTLVVREQRAAGFGPAAAAVHPHRSRAGTSPASATPRPPPCAPSWTAAGGSARGRAPLAAQLADRLRPLVPGARPDWPTRSSWSTSRPQSRGGR